MRPYRGKTKDGKWVCGHLFEEEMKDGSYKPYIIEDAYFSILETQEEDEAEILGDIFEVLPETVGQSTGLHDKNGKEIYKGSKFEKDGLIGYVDQADSGLWIISWDDGTTTCLYCDDNFEWRHDEQEIIGTIHDKEKK